MKYFLFQVTCLKDGGIEKTAETEGEIFLVWCHLNFITLSNDLTPFNEF